MTTPAPSAVAKALIVTTDLLAPSYRALAAVHTSLGQPTEVLTVETICATHTCSTTDDKNDTAKAIKDTLHARTGLSYVLLGGALSQVPSRYVDDAYQNPLITTIQFQAHFVTDAYYADSSEWDGNHNGVYAETTGDSPDLMPELVVVRLPFSTVTDVDRYVQRVIHHLTDYDSAKVKTAAFISNIAANVPVASGTLPVDSAWYFENSGRTLSLVPTGFQISKLYASSLDPAAPKSTRDNVLGVFNGGPNLIVHSGHSGHNSLITEQDGTNRVSGTDVLTLTNTNHPILLSCGCEAGDFERTATAGELLLSAPNGGAIAYLGNVPVGLGLAGGMQFIDEMLRFVKNSPDALIGDAFKAAHLNLPKTDKFALPGIGLPVPVLDANSYRWTQKGVTLFADPLLPVWTAARTSAPTATISGSPVCQGTQLTVSFSASVTGTVQVLVGSDRYSFSLSGQSSAQLTVPGDVHDASVGTVMAGRWYGFQTLHF